VDPAYWPNPPRSSTEETNGSYRDWQLINRINFFLWSLLIICILLLLQLYSIEKIYRLIAVLRNNKYYFVNFHHYLVPLLIIGQYKFFLHCLLLQLDILQVLPHEILCKQYRDAILRD
jgi:hypothetical protein